MATVHRQHLAMATQFETWLVGEDLEHLDAVASAVFEEIDRVERLLSRFDPASEISRVNRQAATQRVQITRELADILEECRRWWQQTNGAFDVVASNESGVPRRLGWDVVDLSPDAWEIHFLSPLAQLDLGAYGKGYALDGACQLLDQFHVASALLHGGTSSIIARGVSETGQSWQVQSEGPIELHDVAYSTSASFVHDQTSDIVDPASNMPVSARTQCQAVARSAAVAEVVSTTGVLRPEQLFGLLDTWVRQGEKRIINVWLTRGESGRRQQTSWSLVPGKST